MTTARLAAALASRYIIERELGRCGIATVYLARAASGTRRPVAIKVLAPDLSQSLGAERFLCEIEPAANLQHPHVVPLFDSGEVGGLLYYVMPYVEGESLRDRLVRRGGSRSRRPTWRVWSTRTWMTRERAAELAGCSFCLTRSQRKPTLTC